MGLYPESGFTVYHSQGLYWAISVEGKRDMFQNNFVMFIYSCFNVSLPINASWITSNLGCKFWTDESLDWPLGLGRTDIMCCKLYAWNTAYLILCKVLQVIWNGWEMMHLNFLNSPEVFNNTLKVMRFIYDLR